MGALQLGYCTFGLTELAFPDALRAIDGAGYAGAELSFHRDQFNPFALTDADLDSIRTLLARLRIQPACVATASYFFDPQRPHEPSLLALERAARKRRIDLIRRGIRVARALHVPLVTFGSGFLRAEHAANPQVDPRDLLEDSIRECLRAIRPDEDITLLIEPEPGMYIETLADGIDLIRRVGSPKFQLHTDLCHAYCSEHEYLSALAMAAPYTRYLHISDARAGYNLKLVQDRTNLQLDAQRASHLVFFPDTADFLLVDRGHPIHFRDAPPTRARNARVAELLAASGITAPLRVVEYADLYAGRSPFDDEIFTWMISLPGFSYDVLERTRPVAAYLRGAAGRPLVDARIANTRTGIVHFHDIPGAGTLDFAASFDALVSHGFSGYGSVELYHHVSEWRRALTESHRQLTQYLPAA